MNASRSCDGLIPHPASPTTCLKNHCLSNDVGPPHAAIHGTAATTATTTSLLSHTGTLSSRAKIVVVSASTAHISVRLNSLTPAD
jgi:hypothetical protein